MSYGLIYTIPFASLRNKSCIIEIEKEGYVGAPTELVGAGNPFTVDIDSYTSRPGSVRPISG